MEKVTVVTCFIEGNRAPSIGVLAGHIPPDDVPLSEVIKKSGTQVGILHTYVAAKPSHDGMVQSQQMALASWSQDGDLRFG
ncbi:MAG TPA: hypothetical protein DCM07_13835 [Planctomycetaceae bacterium]|uniref:hypothetical protein n=1 Tax=Gimesia sp. TaxID=2024833 RepID=UPI000C621D06|nr:hypothetical protein [Gimesia sp.]MAX35319.1 hypothetical protein [Gimesia sp.]HAH45906.1 hypothetical protein [Planctomycetaceae bacterium]|tara:strand:+ start:973 stop:1215 length:243 start_codon:yes stop_codon:yes gene_type:complete